MRAQDGPVLPNTLLMQNHGFCTFGETVAEAWVLAYYFNRSCMTQMAVLQSGAAARCVLKPNQPNP